MLNTRRVSFLLIVFSGFLQVAQAQDSSYSSLEARLMKQYTAGLDMNVSLYNGPEYPYYQFRIHEGHPYFDSSSFVFGSVTYGDIYYDNSALLFDLVTGELVVRHHKNFSGILLDKHLVRSFSLGGHTFLNLSDPGQSIPQGYYDRLYNGDIKVFARRVKYFSEQASGNDILKKVYDRVSYYIFNEGNYIPIRSEGQLLSIFKDKRREVQQQLRRKKIRFRSNRELAIIEAASYYDRLIK